MREKKQAKMKNEEQTEEEVHKHKDRARPNQNLIVGIINYPKWKKK
jgi:hypothetical protein